MVMLPGAGLRTPALLLQLIGATVFVRETCRWLRRIFLYPVSPEIQAYLGLTSF
jgi:hypothetical protein